MARRWSRFGMVVLALSGAACQAAPAVPAPIEELSLGIKKGLSGALNGDADYCDNSAAKCAAGEGDCDSDAQCVAGAGLVCGALKGAQFGFPGDACVPAHCNNHSLDADETTKDCGGSCGSQCYVPANVCRTDAPCGVGQGDCDNHAECMAGLLCKHPGGRQYGVAGDVCVPAHCTDHVQNDGETQVDCGGECGKICNASCWDGLQNNGESGVDCGGTCARCDGPEEGPLALASAGSALLKIAVSPTASPEVVALAKVLQRKLKDITGADFTIVYDGSRGIRLGVPGDFAEWPYTMSTATPPQSLTFTSQSPFDREDYIIRSVPGWGTLALAGANTVALENAVWGFLDTLGYRHYMPSPIWEITPRLPELEVDLDQRVHPAFSQRRIQFSSRAWTLADDPTTDPYSGLPYTVSADCKNANGTSQSYEACALNSWMHRNRMTGAEIVPGENWDGVKELAITNHPGVDQALFWPNPNSPKPCLSVQQTLGGEVLTAERFAREFAADVFAHNPSLLTLSMEAGDEAAGAAGAPWCSADAAAGLSKSDIVVRMANAAAAGIPAGPERKIVVRSYSTHTEAPSVAINPRVFVEFYQTNVFEPIIQGWKTRYSTNDPSRLFGIRTRYTTASEEPGSSIGAQPDAVARTIRDYAANRLNGLFEVETVGAGVTGLGQWLASRLLWDPTQDSDALRDEFLLKAFGPANVAMDKFYSYLASPTLSTHWINSAYRRLSDALAVLDADTQVPADEKTRIRQRIRDLAVYVRYLDLRRGLVSDCIYSAIQAPGQPVPSNAERVSSILELAYATRTSMVLPSGAFFSSTCRTIGAESAGCAQPSSTTVAAIKQAANAAPVTAAQIEAWIAAGAARPIVRYTGTAGIERDLPVDRETPFLPDNLVPMDLPEPPDRAGNGASENAGIPITAAVIEDSDSGVGRWYVWPASGSLAPLMVTGCTWCAKTPGSAHFYAAAAPVGGAPFWTIDQYLNAPTSFNVGNPAGGAPIQLYTLDVRGGGQDSARSCTSDPNAGVIDHLHYAGGGISNTCSARMVRLAISTDSNRFTSEYDSLFAVPRGTSSVAGYAQYLTQAFRWYQDAQNHWARTCVKIPAYTLSQCSGVAEHFSIPNQTTLEDCGGVNQGSNPQTYPVPQPPGDVTAQAQVWKLRDAKGRLALLTVPPVLGRHPREFLLPAGTLVP